MSRCASKTTDKLALANALMVDLVGKLEGRSYSLLLTCRAATSDGGRAK
jgi:hypothetical protein